MNKLQKFLSVVFFIAIFVVLIYFIQNYGIEPLRNKVESMGIWAPFGIFILRINHNYLWNTKIFFWEEI